MSNRMITIISATIGMLGLVLFGSIGFHVWDNFNNVTTATDCTVTEMDTYYSKGDYYTLDTTCGKFGTDSDTYEAVTVGSVYTFTVNGTIAPFATL